MITALFLIIYVAYVVLLSIYVPLLYLIPVWLITGYAVALALVVLIVYVNYIWMSRTSALNKFKNYIAHSIIFLLNHFFVRIKLDIEGKEYIPKDGRITTYANHKSLLDPLVMFELIKRPISFTPKSEVMSWPFLGKYLKYLGSMVIDRSSDRNTARGLVDAIHLAKQGMNYIIFPEGGIRTREVEKMVEMRPGAYKVAMKAKTDLLIVTLKNMTQIHKRSPWRKTTIKVIVHPVVPYDTIKDMNSQEIAQMVFDIVNKDFE